MPRLADNTIRLKGLARTIVALSLLFFLACTPEHKNEVDRLNTQSYAFHYKSLDSTENCACKALALAESYSDGRAEAYNNLAFVSIGRMNYQQASELLDSVAEATDNQVELLVADIQCMRLCQRTARNKEFYDYNERARLRIRRIEEERHALTGRLQERFVYAKSEYAIVRSTYYYYVGLQKQSKAALDSISVSELQQDTAQYLNYLYQVGSGGIIDGENDYEVCQQEFENLLECFLVAQHGGYLYWEANSLQALSEHLVDKERRLWLTTDNSAAFNYLNQDNMPDSLVAGYFAQRSLNIFMQYGDVYQTAGAYRTLASCYWALGDYISSLVCLKNALADKRIGQTPDLEASIREQLSMTYSALDDKADSDFNRNLYLDMQEKSRQDRQLEARAEQLERISTKLNALAVCILCLLIVTVALIFVLYYLRRHKGRSRYIETLLNPLREWEKLNERHFKELAEQRERIEEEFAASRLRIVQDKRRNVENRAKIFLANSVMPLIDRIINEAERLEYSDESEERKRERLEYITELTGRITECNDVLTSWIQLRQGQLGLKIESFKLQSVFDIVRRASMSFQLKGVTLLVEPTDATVKADRILTLFMINTLADNSRKFTEKGGTVKISATEGRDYIEVSVEDDGCGMSEEELTTVFNRQIKPGADASLDGGHGFGLQNCRGIIEKYRKVSRLFSICTLSADSKKGHGSRFFFRLPCGVMRALCVAAMLVGLDVSAQEPAENDIAKDSIVLEQDNRLLAAAYADSAYYSNVNGRYAKTLRYVATAIQGLNGCYKKICPKGRRIMALRDDGSGTPAEIEWFHAGVKADYGIILDIRNEAAVAALALHDWDAYRYNNKIYTQLFKLCSADSGLAEYCRTMQRSSTNMAIAVAILVLLLLVAVFSYYFIYYRHVLYFRFCVDNINALNGVLIGSDDDEHKLCVVRQTDTRKYPETLRCVVDAIRAALERSVAENGRSKTDIEMAADELHRADFDDAKLYVCNNVTDNCLSALKHETMYYPSRISQIVDSSEHDFHALAEVARYYRELCNILSRQAASIAKSVKPDCRRYSCEFADGQTVWLVGDEDLLEYSLELIRKLNGGAKPELGLEQRSGRYVVLVALCRNIRLAASDVAELFTPLAENIPYLICRQIVRDAGEATNLHACGIVAEASPDGLLLHITLPAG